MLDNSKKRDIIKLSNEREETNMKNFEVYVAGTLKGTFTTREEAEQFLNALRNSFLAMVHPRDVFYIKEVK